MLNSLYVFASQEDKDAAQRMHDTVALHLTAARDLMDEVVGRWCVFRLTDGTSNGDTYDTKEQAVRHHEPYEKDHCYLKITPDGIRPEDALRYLNINRHPMIDTTAPEHVIGPALFPRHSNLTTAQKRELKQLAENEARKHGWHG